MKQPKPEPEKTPIAPKAEPPTNPDENSPEPKPGEQVSEHPEFDKRIAELTGQLGHLKRQLERAEQAGQEKDQSFQVLADQYQEMSKTLDNVESQVAVSAAPDYDENPKAYLDWQQQQTLKHFEKMLKPTNKPPMAKNTPTQNNSQTDPREAALAAINADYYEIMAEVNKDINADPAFCKAVWETPNPYKTAYDHGIKKREYAKNFRDGTLSQAYAETGSGSNSVEDTNTLTAAEKAMVAKMQGHGTEITEESYLASKIKLSKMRR